MRHSKLAAALLAGTAVLAQPAAAKPPVRIVLTNYTLASYRTAAKRMGADYFFDKSNEIPEMLRVIRGLGRRANKANGGPC